MAAPTLEIDVAPLWGQDVDWEALSARAARAAAHVAPELGFPEILVSVVFADDAEVRTLNRQWRAKDKPTNVLSFPMLAREEILAAAHDGAEPVMLGDVILAFETCRREAEEKSIAFTDHATHLLIHGLLHLAGHDHERGEAEANAMEDMEVRALARLNIANPYQDAT